MNEKINNLISNLKHQPGVYLMRDINNNVIYVGKAKDLYNRVSQYFLKPQSGKVFKMVQNVDYFETIITANEKEALILEMNLIQKYYPKFNILLKDDKHYPYIALKKENDPYIQIKRDDKDKKFIYFGPFPNSSAARDMINLLNQIFPLRKCKNIPSSPCLYYHLGTCLAPCINKIDQEVYDSLLSKIKSFLKGQNKDIYNSIKNKMLIHSENLEFERAEEYKKILDAIDHLNTKQNVEMFDKKNRDIFAFTSREKFISLAILNYREGLLLGKKTFVLEEFGDIEEEVSDLILQYYQKSPLPQEIAINNNKVIEILKNYLETTISEYSKGPIFDLIVTASKNASDALDQYFLSAKLDSEKLEMLEELGEVLSIPTPLHIELFDNSHIQGAFPVGVMVAFINGEASKKLYRKFRIEHSEARDDLMSMKEIIYRHYSRSVKEEKKLPDLILLDGGVNQINAVKHILEELELNIPIFGLFKNDKHQTKGLIDSEENIYEIKNKSLFFLLTRMQDEVHRYAITFHRSLRSKGINASIFDGVIGLGRKRIDLLEKRYLDINSLKNASVEELCQILPRDVAKNLFNKLHN